MKSLAEFRQDAGIKLNLKKLAAQGELPKGQERVAWAMYVRKDTSQAGSSGLSLNRKGEVFSVESQR